MNWNLHANNSIGLWINNEGISSIHTPLGTLTWNANERRREVGFRLSPFTLSLMFQFGETFRGFSLLGAHGFIYDFNASYALVDNDGNHYTIREGYRYDKWSRLPWRSRKVKISRIESGEPCSFHTVHKWGLTLEECRSIVANDRAEWKRYFH